MHFAFSEFRHSDSFVVRHSGFVIHFINQFCYVLSLENFSDKILLRSSESSFTRLEVFYDCSGGNSRPSHPSGVGGGNFLQTKVCALTLARALAQ